MKWLKIFVSTHPEAAKYISYAVLVAALIVLFFQVATTAVFFEGRGDPNPDYRTLKLLFGAAIGFVIAALEYCFIEGLKNQWQGANSDSKITTGEWIIIGGLFALLAVVLAVDFMSSRGGAIGLGFDETVSSLWGGGQLLAFEYLFNMFFNLRDLAAKA